jgi:hypothetical protein
MGSSIKPFSARPSDRKWITPKTAALSAANAFAYRLGNSRPWPSDLANGVVVIHDLNADKYLNLLPILRHPSLTTGIQVNARVWRLSGSVDNTSETDFVAQLAFDLAITSGEIALPAGASVRPAITTGNPRFANTIVASGIGMPSGSVQAIHSGLGSIASLLIDKTSAIGLLIEFSTNATAVPADAVTLLGAEF